jgi:nucleotide-binding universal stress UspA family protein
MYQNILVPLDGSPRAEMILPHVESLAHCIESHLVLLMVIKPLSIYVSEGGYVPDLESLRQGQNIVIENGENYLKGLAGEFREKNIPAKTLVVEGSVVQTIINVAERENADLVAMASHGRTGLANVFYGSVAVGVLHRIDRPLLLIRADDD